MSNKLPSKELALAVVHSTKFNGSDDENIQRALDIYQKAFSEYEKVNKEQVKPARISNQNLW